MCLLRKFTAKSLSESRYRNREEKKKHVVELQNIECHVTHRANRNLPNNNTVSLELIFFLLFFLLRFYGWNTSNQYQPFDRTERNHSIKRSLPIKNSPNESFQRMICTRDEFVAYFWFELLSNALVHSQVDWIMSAVIQHRAYVVLSWDVDFQYGFNSL